MEKCNLNVDAEEDRRLAQLRDELDQKFFESCLEHVAVAFAPLSRTTQAIYMPEDVFGFEFIRIRSSLWRDELELRSAMIHVMIHAYHTVIGHPCMQYRNSSHGAAFKAQLIRIGAEEPHLLTHVDKAVCSSVEPEDLENALTELKRFRGNKNAGCGRWNRLGQWIPHVSERFDCCDRVEFQHGLDAMWKHCRSLTHVSRLYGVDPIELRRLRNPKKQA